MINIKKLLNSKTVIYLLMTFLVFLWGLEYIAAKAALELIEPLTLVCMKYLIGFVLLIILKAFMDRRLPIRKKDIPLLFVCALFGEVLYFASEYYAMDYLPVSIITIILAFVPLVSIAAEAVIFKQLPTISMVVGIVIGIVGIGLVIGADFSDLFSGKYIGYLLAFSAVLCWNIYNFITKGLSERHKPLDLTLMQQICSIILVLPYTLFHLPPVEAITSEVLGGVIYLGAVSAFIGFLIYIKAINVIGPTPCALFSNFLPVTSTFFGWIFLNEHLVPIQLFGGLIVILAGAFVIRRKDRLDAEREKGIHTQGNVSEKP